MARRCHMPYLYILPTATAWLGELLCIVMHSASPAVPVPHSSWQGGSAPRAPGAHLQVPAGVLLYLLQAVQQLQRRQVGAAQQRSVQKGRLLLHIGCCGLVQLGGAQNLHGQAGGRGGSAV